MQYEAVNLFGEKELVDDGIATKLFSDGELLDTAFNEFRKYGFPYPTLTLTEMKRQLNELRNLKREQCVHSTLAYRIADTYNKHRFHSSAINMRSPYDGFMDDKALRKVIKMQFETNGKVEYGYLGFMSLVNGVQACSNFRPAFAKLLYDKHSAKGARVFDSSTGYGGRLVGFIGSHCEEYHGTDPNTLTYKANIELAAHLHAGKKITLYNSPIEDLDISGLESTFDFSFTSPPYFIKEIYSSEPTQSCQRYKQYSSWVEGFLRPMVNKNFSLLKPGAICIINIEDVKVKGQTYNLVQSTHEEAKMAGFIHIEDELFHLQARTRIVDGVKTIINASERVIILKKPE